MRAVLARQKSISPKCNGLLKPRAAQTPRCSRSLHSASACKANAAKYNHLAAVGCDNHDGVPFAVKDNIATTSLSTGCASNILKEQRFPFNATVVERLQEAGYVAVSKTNLDEFGMGSHSTHSRHGPVSNPLSADVAYSAGGSSGGSAVAVQLGEVPFALGTDTGGSVRIPAAYTGTVGYKPSYGMISRYGVIPYANSLDTVGIIAKTPADIYEPVFGTRVAKDHDAKDPTSLRNATRSHCSRQMKRSVGQNSQVTVGIPQEYNLEELDPEIRKAWSDTARRLEETGVKVVAVSMPEVQAALGAYYVIAAAEASSNLAKYDGVRYGIRGDGSDADGETLYSQTRGAGFGDEVKRRILLGTYSLSSEAINNYFIQAQKVRRLVARSFDKVFKMSHPLRDESQFDLSDMEEATEMLDKHGPAQVDFLLCPTAPTFPPKLSDVAKQSIMDVYANDVFTVPASLAGLPAMSVPVPVGGSRFPAGMQLIAQYWDDERLLAFAQKMFGEMNGQTGRL